MKIMMKIAGFGLLLIIAGCGFTSEGDFARKAVKEYGAQAYDEGLENAEWFICNAVSVGAIRRKYGRTEERAQTYRQLCLGAGDVKLFEAEGN